MLVTITATNKRTKQNQDFEVHNVPEEKSKDDILKEFNDTNGKLFADAKITGPEALINGEELPEKTTTPADLSGTQNLGTTNDVNAAAADKVNAPADAGKPAAVTPSGAKASTPPATPPAKAPKLD